MGRGSLVFVLAVARAAAADPADADKLVEEASTLAQNGDFVGAAAKFRAAYAVDPRPELVCNIGVAYQKAKELPRAQMFLSQCMVRGSSLDPKFVDSVRKVLASVEDKLRNGDFTPIDIVVEPASATVGIGEFAADETFVGSRLVWLPYGTHKIFAKADGYADQTRDVETTSRSQRTVRVVLERAGEQHAGSGAGSGSAVPAGSGAASGSGAAVVPPLPKPAGPSVILPVVGSVVTGILVIGATVTYVGARAKANDAAAEHTQTGYDMKKQDAINLQHTSWTLASIAVVAGGVTGYLWWRYVHTSAHVEVEASGHGAAATFTTSW